MGGERGGPNPAPTGAGVESWQQDDLVRLYLDTVRGAVPLAERQLEVMVQVLRTRDEPVRRFLDLGCGDGVLAAALLAEDPRAGRVRRAEGGLRRRLVRP